VIITGADTVVVGVDWCIKLFYSNQEIDDAILEKPKDKDGAHNMLQKYEWELNNE